VRGGKSQPLYAIQCSNRLQQIGKIHRISIFPHTTVGVNVLAEQRNFLHALLHQNFNITHNISPWT
jgi:hypothetical protein